MLRVVSAFKIVDRQGAEILLHEPKRFMVETEAVTFADDFSRKHGAMRIRAVPCFMLEVQTERGEPTYFDLGNPVDIAR